MSERGVSEPDVGRLKVVMMESRRSWRWNGEGKYVGLCQSAVKTVRAMYWSCLIVLFVKSWSHEGVVFIEGCVGVDVETRTDETPLEAV